MLTTSCVIGAKNSVGPSITQDTVVTLLRAGGLPHRVTSNKSSRLSVTSGN